MTANCYIWKWADNDIPGQPTEVHGALLQGETHPALQAFDARPVLKAIEKLARDNQEDWMWCAEPKGEPRKSHFVYLNLPEPADRRAMHHTLARRLLRLGVTCYDEDSGTMGDWFPPKLNEFQCGQWPGEMLYDIREDELPTFLKRIRPTQSNPYAVLSNRRGHFVQCYAHRRVFCVEWRRNNPVDHRDFDHWRAQYPQVEPVEYRINPKNGVSLHPKCELIRYADTLRIFKSFLRGEPLPDRYVWRDIKPLLSKKATSRQKSKATQP